VWISRPTEIDTSRPRFDALVIEEAEFVWGTIYPIVRNPLYYPFTQFRDVKICATVPVADVRILISSLFTRCCVCIATTIGVLLSSSIILESYRSPILDCHPVLTKRFAADDDVAFEKPKN
jgi:hypothetical protein